MSNLKRTIQNQEEQQIFLVFLILKQSKEEANEKENIFGFLNCNSKIKKTELNYSSKQNKKLQLELNYLVFWVLRKETTQAKIK